MGRKSRHTNPLSDVDAAATHATMLRAFQGVGPTQIANGLMNFRNREVFEFIETNDWINASFDIDPSTVSRFLKGEISLNGGNLWAFFLWMKEDYGKILADKQLEEMMNKKEPLVRAVKEAFGFGENLDLAVIKPLKGSYKLFRPSFLKPERDIMICRLDIGFEEKSPFSCRLISFYRGLSGADVTDTFVGKIIPYGDKMMSIMTSLSNATHWEFPSNASVVMHLDDIRRASDQPLTSELGGIILTATGPDPSSAWPIYACRMSEEEADMGPQGFKPLTLPLADYPDVPEAALSAFSRGVVNWQRYRTQYDAPRP